MEFPPFTTTNAPRSRRSRTCERGAERRATADAACARNAKGFADAVFDADATRTAGRAAATADMVNADILCELVDALACAEAGAGTGDARRALGPMGLVIQKSDTWNTDSRVMTGRIRTKGGVEPRARFYASRALARCG